MARTNNYGAGIIGPSGQYLDRMFNSPMQDREHMRIKQHELTIQDALLEEEESSHSKRKGTLETDSSSTQRTQQQSNRNKESSQVIQLQEKKEVSLPLKEAVILAEIIGQPRCRNRYQRRGSR